MNFNYVQWSLMKNLKNNIKEIKKLLNKFLNINFIKNSYNNKLIQD